MGRAGPRPLQRGQGLGAPRRQGKAPTISVAKEFPEIKRDKETVNIKKAWKSVIPKTTEGRANLNRARPNISGASGAKVMCFCGSGADRLGGLLGVRLRGWGA